MHKVHWIRKMILQNIGRQTFAHFFSSYIIDYNEENGSKKGVSILDIEY